MGDPDERPRRADGWAALAGAAVVRLGRGALARVRVPPWLLQEGLATAAAALPPSGPGAAPARSGALARPGSQVGDLAALALGVTAAAGLVDGTRTSLALRPQQPPGGRPARGTEELLQRVDALSPARGAPPGVVRVERVSAPGRPQVAVVYIPGTQDWSLRASGTPMDAGTNLRALAGRGTAATDAVTRALRASGVRPDEPLLLVGHSQGGMTAAHLAADPAFRAEFRPTAVLTAGSPIGDVAVPDDVAVLSLEHDDDLVPAADGADNPDEPSWTTVLAPSGDDPHAASGYADTGALVDSSDDPSLVAWRQAAAPFLDGGAGAGPVVATSAEWVARREG